MSKALFAEARRVEAIEDCLFYHTTDIPGHGTVEGYWDIRGHESQYLGDTSFDGKRVLEIGPASGLLSFFMERRGGEVVSIEAAEDYQWELYWDLKEASPQDLPDKLSAHREMMERLKNSYWFCHRAHSSKARVHYGSAYNVPQELGEFDLSVLACILLHNKNPLRIIENCARVTRETIVIVEPFRERQFPQPSIEFLPEDNRHSWHTWWGFSPEFLVGVLASMGFPHSRVTYHTQQCFGEPADLFTIAASRSLPEAGAPEEATIAAELSCPVERLKLAAGELTSLPLKLFNRGDAPLSSLSDAPLLLSYHWRDEAGRIAVWDGLRTPLPRTLSKGERANILLSVRAPDAPGIYTLEISLMREGVAWYDEMLRGLPCRVESVVTPGA